MLSFIMANLLNIKLEPTYDLLSIGFADMSHYDYPQSVIGNSIEITPPGFPKISKPFTIQSVNIYRSNDLGISCSNENLLPLPDGRYSIKYSISPSTDNYVEKSFYRIDNLICQFEEKFLQIDLPNCNCIGHKQDLYKKRLREIRLLFESLIVASNTCNFNTCDYIYDFIQKQLASIKDCDCL